MTEAPDLTALAAAYGVSTGYWDQAGRRVEVSRESIAAVLRALGADPTDEVTVARSLRDREEQPWRRTLPPVVVTAGGRYGHAWVHLPHGTSVRVWIECEDGTIIEPAQLNRWVEPREIDGQLVGEATFAIPSDLPLGWHSLHAVTESGVHQCPLVVTPERLDPPALDESARLWGFMAQLYSVRSRRSWGIGDLADLADLASWSGRLGADFVLVNPMHAADLAGPITPSPYLPSTRRFPSPLYLRVEDVPEFAYLRARDYRRIRRLSKGVRRLEGDLLDRDASWAAKDVALDLVRQVPLTPGRQARYDAFVAREGIGLIDYATWCSISEVHGSRWQEWPEGLRHPASSEVIAWRESHADAIERHLWLQWLLDEQLERTQSASVEVGMRAGVIHDLAVGVTADGADAWAYQDVLVPGMSVGAPPDMYNQVGQDWAQPPWDPAALADAAFVPYRDMLRTLLRHSGGLRIDHILGLFRQWWVPDGMAASAGTYVAFDHDALLGILALEAHRAGALIIGEDLGTLEPWVQEALRDRGLLGTSIMWFERSEDGQLREPEWWRADVLASVAVHDLPPTAGYLEGEHVRIRHELGLLERPIEDERDHDSARTQEWIDLARARGYLSAEDDVPTVDDVVVALHRIVAASPARLVGIALPDVVGERRAQNQPGTHREYPNWCVPLGDRDGHPVALDDLPASPLLPALLEAVRARP